MQGKDEQYPKKDKGKEKVEIENDSYSDSLSSESEQEELASKLSEETSKQTIIAKLELLLHDVYSYEKANNNEQIRAIRQQLLAIYESLSDFDEQKPNTHPQLLKTAKPFQLILFPDMKVESQGSFKTGDIIAALQLFTKLLSADTVHIETAIIESIKHAKTIKIKHAHLPSASSLKEFTCMTAEEMNLQISQLREILKNCYTHQPGIPLLLDETKTFGIDKVFVDLELVTQLKEKQKKDGEGRNDKVLFNAYEERNFYERCEFKQKDKSSKVIQPEDLFKEKDKFISRVFLQGAAGIGKTTLCRYLTYRWAKGELWVNDFELLIYLPLREIVVAYDQKKYNLETFILGNWVESATLGQYDSYGKSLITNSQQHALSQFIQTSPTKVLWLLDGLDEVDREHPAIKALLSYTPCYLVTSRPASVPEGIKRCVEHIGLSPANRKRYIKRYFSLMQEEGKAHPLIRWLKSNPQVWGLSSITVTCQLLCIAYQQNQQLPHTLSLTQLYALLMVQWQRRAFLRDKALQGKLKLDKLAEWNNKQIAVYYSDITQLLGKICYHALLEPSGVLITGTLLQEVIEESLAVHHAIVTPKAMRKLRKKLLNLGVLKAQGLSSNPYQDRYEFAHLTFVEYLAAFYLAQGFAAAKQDKYYQIAKQALIDNLYIPKFTLVWRFVAGYLAAQKSSGLNIYLNKVIKAQDLYGFEQTLLWLACMEEAYEALSEKQPKLIEYSEQLLLLWLDEKKGLRNERIIITLLQQCFKFCQSELIQNSLKEIYLDNDNFRATLNSLLPKDYIAALMDYFLITSQELTEKYERIGERFSLNLLYKLFCGCPSDIQIRYFAFMVPKLKHKNWKIRAMTLWTLGILNPHLSQEAIIQCFEAILPLLNDDNYEVREMAFGFLESLIPYLSNKEKQLCFEESLSYFSRVEKDNWPWLRKNMLKNLRAWLPTLRQETKARYLQAILPLLNTDNSILRTKAFKAIEVFFPDYSEKERIDCLKAIFSDLDDNDCHIRERAFHALKVIFPHCSNEEKIDCLKAIRLHFDSIHDHFHEAALDTLPVLFSVFFPEKIRCLKSILSQFNNEDTHIRQMNLEALKDLLPYCAQEEKTYCFNSILPQLYAKDKTQDEATLQALQDLLPYCLSGEKKQCLQPILQRIKDCNYLVLRVAFNTLQALLPCCTPEEKASCLAAILKLLEHNDWQTVETVLEFLPPLLPSYSQAEKTICFNAILPLLNNKDVKVCKATLNALQALLPYLLQAEKTNCFNAILQKLKGEEKALQIEAIETLKAMLPYCSKEEKIVCLEAILPQLEDNDWLMRLPAIRALQALLPSCSPKEKRQCLGAILSRLGDDHSLVREAALEALQPLLLSCSQDEKTKSLQAILRQLQSTNSNSKEIKNFLQDSCLFYIYTSKTIKCHVGRISFELALPSNTIAELIKNYLSLSPNGHYNILQQLRNNIKKKVSSHQLSSFASTKVINILEEQLAESQSTYKVKTSAAKGMGCLIEQDIAQFKQSGKKGLQYTFSVFKKVSKETSARYYFWWHKKEDSELKQQITKLAKEQLEVRIRKIIIPSLQAAYQQSPGLKPMNRTLDDTQIINLVAKFYSQSHPGFLYELLYLMQSAEEKLLYTANPKNEKEIKSPIELAQEIHQTTQLEELNDFVYTITIFEEATNQLEQMVSKEKKESLVRKIIGPLLRTAYEQSADDSQPITATIEDEIVSNVSKFYGQSHQRF